MEKKNSFSRLPLVKIEGFVEKSSIQIYVPKKIQPSKFGIIEAR